MSEYINIEKSCIRPKCGEIWMCNLSKSSGSVQGGYRPVFILSNNMNNAYSTTLNIIPMTTKMNKRNLPVHVELRDYRRFGLRAPSTLLVEQIMTVSLSDLSYRVGEISDRVTLNNICKAITVQFPIINNPVLRTGVYDNLA